jgi:hypothetical protein
MHDGYLRRIAKQARFGKLRLSTCEEFISLYAVRLVDIHCRAFPTGVNHDKQISAQ